MNNKLIQLNTKNFKGLGEFNFEPKSSGINIIYGDNGVGKSSFVKVFNFLTIIMQNVKLRASFSDEMNMMMPMFQDSLFKSLNNPYEYFSSLFNDEDIEIELTLNMQEDYYKYGVSLNKFNQITYEYFYLMKRSKHTEVKKVIFEKKLNISFSQDFKFFEDFGLLSNEITKRTTNSIVSIIDFNTDKNFGAILRKKGNPVIMLITSFVMLNVIEHAINNEDNFMMPLILLPSINVPLDNSLVKERFYREVEEFEDFVLAIDDKIRRINVVEKPLPNGLINLQIEFVQIVNGVQINVPLVLMSSGTKDYFEYFKILHFITNGFQDDNLNNDIVSSSFGLFDEFGLHLHPTLAIKILNYFIEIAKQFDKQIFFTSHQTVLLEKKYTNLANENKLIMSRTFDGYTRIRTLKGEGNKDNNHDKFLRGDYGGNDLNKIII